MTRLIAIIFLLAAGAFADGPPTAQLWQRNANGSISPKGGKSVAMDTTLPRTLNVPAALRATPDGDTVHAVTMVNDPANPTIPHTCEPSIIMNTSGGADMFYTRTMSNKDVWLSTATNSLLDNWSAPVSVLHDEGQLLYPSVFLNAGTYYLLATKSDGHLYMWSSTTKTSFTALNGGSPVMHHSANGSAWNYIIRNSSAVMVGGTIHLVVEAATVGATLPYDAMGYSTATLDNLNFDTAAVKIMQYVVCPEIKYVADRNSLLVLAGYVSNGITEIRAIRASLTDNLAVPASWHLSSNFLMAKAGVHLADPSIVDTTSQPAVSGRPPLILAYNYDQLDMWQAWSSLTLLQLYDLIAGSSQHFFGQPVYARGGIKTNRIAAEGSEVLLLESPTVTSPAVSNPVITGATQSGNLAPTAGQIIQEHGNFGDSNLVGGGWVVKSSSGGNVWPLGAFLGRVGCPNTTANWPGGWAIYVKPPGTTSTAMVEVARFCPSAGMTLIPTPQGSLAPCVAALDGSSAAVTDSNTNTYGATIGGGGGYHVKAYCNGTNWVVN